MNLRRSAAIATRTSSSTATYSTEPGCALSGYPHRPSLRADPQSGLERLLYRRMICDTPAGVVRRVRFATEHNPFRRVVAVELDVRVAIAALRRTFPILRARASRDVGIARHRHPGFFHSVEHAIQRKLPRPTAARVRRLEFAAQRFGRSSRPNIPRSPVESQVSSGASGGRFSRTNPAIARPIPCSRRHLRMTLGWIAARAAVEITVLFPRFWERRRPRGWTQSRFAPRVAPGVNRRRVRNAGHQTQRCAASLAPGACRVPTA